MRDLEQQAVMRPNDRGLGMICTRNTKSISCFKDQSTSSSCPHERAGNQETRENHPHQEVRFARKCRTRRIPKVKVNDKNELYYSKHEIQAFSRDYQQEQNGLFVVFQILSGAKETPALEDLL
jgi:hypothetical protein